MENEKTSYGEFSQDVEFSKIYDGEYDSEDDDEEEDETKEDVVPRLWMAQEEQAGQASQVTETPAVTKGESQIYPKGFPMIQSMGYSGQGGLGKDGKGLFEPIILEERPKNLGLGADPNTPTISKVELQSTFTSAQSTIEDFDKLMEHLGQGTTVEIPKVSNPPSPQQTLGIITVNGKENGTDEQKNKEAENQMS